MYLKGLRFSSSVLHSCIFLIFLGITSIHLLGQTSSGSYSTSFPNSENPISEGGHWVNGGTAGLQWSNVRTTTGLAFGTQSGSVNYNDSTAVLTGTWAGDQSAQATVKVVRSDSGSGLFEEVELRLRTTIKANSITGYEINCSVIAGNPYMQIVRWNGAFGSWTELDGRPVGCQNGDVLKATAVGSTITAYKNGSAVFSVTDGTYSNGAPGIGLYLEGGSSFLNSHFGFSNFTAVSLGTSGSSSDTTPPSTPTNLSGKALSSSQISLTWSASTDNVGVTGYRIYRNNVQVGTSSPTSYTDSGLSANTSYTYKVAAVDAAGNVSAQSSSVTVATLSSADTTPPSVPTNLTASSVTSNSATINWTASTDNVGVAGYRVFRNGTQIGTTSSTSYNDSGLVASTSYSYTIAAYDSANNVSAQSQALAVTTTAAAAQTLTPTFVQVNQNQISSGTNVGASFQNANTAGNTIVAYVIWDNTGTATVSDSRGDAFKAVSTPVTWGGSHKAQVFYATNIAGGANTVTARFGTSVSSFGVLYIHEYSGINGSNPVDVTVQASGSSSTLNSGAATTTTANDLIFGAGVSDNVVTGAGSGFAARDMAFGNITEDRTGSTIASYSATATHNGNAWGMQMVAFRPAGSSSGAAASTYSVSGTISGGAGSTVSLSGANSATTTADANGNFSFGNLANGSYTVTPSKSGLTFSPASANVTVSGGNVTGTNFTATSTQPSTWSISGSISPAASGAGAIVALSGAKNTSTTADTNGNFTFTGLANGSYTLTPSKSGFTFSPASANVTVNGANVTGTSFTATANQPSTWSISGSISPAVDGAGATLALSGARSASTTADGNGNFSFSGLANGSYVVTPSKSGFTFSPSSSSVTVNGANVTGTNFTTTAVSNTHSVDLNWTASTSSSVSGYKIYRSTTSGGPYTLVSSAPVTSTVYTDLNVTGGTSYYYVVTAVDSAGNESVYSNQAVAAVPAP